MTSICMSRICDSSNSIRHVDRIGLIELFHHRRLVAVAQVLLEFAAHVGGHVLAQLRNSAFGHAEDGAELLVEFGQRGFLDALHGDLENRVLAGQLRGAVVGGEIHADFLALAGRGADQSLLELRQHPPLAQHDRDVLALAAGKRRTVDRPSKSMVTLSPLAAARVTGVYFICCLRSRSIIASMSLSVTSAVTRSTSSESMGCRATSGNTSNVAT
jgi:hypothetical protein